MSVVPGLQFKNLLYATVRRFLDIALQFVCFTVGYTHFSMTSTVDIFKTLGVEHFVDGCVRDQTHLIHLCSFNMDVTQTSSDGDSCPGIRYSLKTQNGT